MSINKNNYEAYLLDYFEGNLFENEKAELVAFALTHPELNINLEDDLIYFEEPNETFAFDKTSLKSNATPTDEEFILYVEGQLDENQKNDFEKFVATEPTLKKELKTWQATILEKPSITYPNKRSLKQYTIAPTIYPLLAAASVITLFILIQEPHERTYYRTNEPLNFAKQTTYSKYNSPLLTIDKEFAKEDKKVIFTNKNSSIQFANQSNTSAQDTAKKDDKLVDDLQNFIANEDQINDTIMNNDSLHSKPILNLQPNQNLASNEENQINSSSDTYTIKEWVVNKLQEKEIIDSTENAPTLLEVAANTIGEYSTNKTDNVKVTSFKIGKFEYYRKKSRHL